MGRNTLYIMMWDFVRLMSMSYPHEKSKRNTLHPPRAWLLLYDADAVALHPDPSRIYKVHSHPLNQMTDPYDG